MNNLIDSGSVVMLVLLAGIHGFLRKTEHCVASIMYRAALLLLACIVSPITYAAEGYDPPIITASVSPSRVVANVGTIRLSYNAENATYCTYEGQRFPPSGSGTFCPYPEGSHAVRFSCTGPGGTRYRMLRWTAYVPSPPPTTSVNIIQRSVFAGQTATLRWSSTNATRCSTGGTRGTQTIGPWSSPGTQTVSVTCYGPGGQATDSDTVRVTASPRPVISTEVSPRQVEANTGQLVFRWSSRHADYCTYEGARYPASGHTTAGPFAAGNHSATFTCTGNGGTTSRTVSWQSIPAPSVSVTQSLTALTTDNTLTISWDSSHADSCRFQGSDRNADGSVTLGPFASGNYSEVLRCTNAVGSINETIRWVVNPQEQEEEEIEETTGEEDTGTAPVEITTQPNFKGFDPAYKIYGKVGSNDFYVGRDSRAGGNGGVVGFYLKEASAHEKTDDHFYDLMYPVSYEAARAEGFTTEMNMPLELSDVNSDGITDLIVHNLEDAALNRWDLIVYAGLSTGGFPAGFTEINQLFKQLFSDINNWYNNRNYFVENAPRVTVPAVRTFEILAAPYTSLPTSFPAKCTAIHACITVYGDSDLPTNFVASGFRYEQGATPGSIRKAIDTIDNPALNEFYFIVRFTFSPTVTTTALDYSIFNDAPVLAEGIDHIIRSDETTLGAIGTSEYADILSNIFGISIINSDTTKDGFFSTISRWAQATAEQTNDVMGSSSLDAYMVSEFIVLQLQGVLSRGMNERAFYAYLDEEGMYQMDGLVEGPTDYRAYLGNPPENVVAVGHTHPNSNAGRRQGEPPYEIQNYLDMIIALENACRELPGKDDHRILEMHGIPNYFLTPEGHVKVLERVSNDYVVRSVGNAPIFPGETISSADYNLFLEGNPVEYVVPMQSNFVEGPTSPCNESNDQ